MTSFIKSIFYSTEKPNPVLDLGKAVKGTFNSVRHLSFSSRSTEYYGLGMALRYIRQAYQEKPENFMQQMEKAHTAMIKDRQVQLAPLDDYASSLMYSNDTSERDRLFLAEADFDLAGLAMHEFHAFAIKNIHLMNNVKRLRETDPVAFDQAMRSLPFSDTDIDKAVNELSMTFLCGLSNPPTEARVGTPTLSDHYINQRAYATNAHYIVRNDAFEAIDNKML